MKKREKYTEQLDDWTRRHKRPRKEKNLVEFLAVREDVTEAVNAGYSTRTIWEHMHAIGRISSQYQTFLKHVNQHIKQKRKTLPETDSEPDSTRLSSLDTRNNPKTQDSGPSEQIKKNPPRNDNFTFNKTPKKEDLF